MRSEYATDHEVCIKPSGEVQLKYHRPKYRSVELIASLSVSTTSNIYAVHHRIVGHSIFQLTTKPYKTNRRYPQNNMVENSHLMPNGHKATSTL